MGHARQLSVGAVKRIGPDEQEHSDHIEPELRKIEEHSGSQSQKDGCYGYGIRGNAEFFCQTGPGISYGPVESEVYVFLGVH